MPKFLLDEKLDVGLLFESVLLVDYVCNLIFAAGCLRDNGVSSD